MFLNHVEYILICLLVVVLYYQIRKLSRRGSKQDRVLEGRFISPGEHERVKEHLTRREVDKLLQSEAYQRYLTDRREGRAEGPPDDDFLADHRENEEHIFEE